MGSGRDQKRAEGIPQTQTAPRRPGCEAGLPYRPLPLQGSSGSHTPWLGGRWGIRDAKFLRLLAPPAQASLPEGPYYSGKLQIHGVTSPVTTQGEGTASNKTGSSNI